MHKYINCCLVLVALAAPLLAQQSSGDAIGCTYMNENSDAMTLTELRGMKTNLYRGQKAFAISMLDAIHKATPNENVFFSPYSTYHALLLAYFGARNHTEKELADVLHLQWAENKKMVLAGYRIEKRTRETRAKKMPLVFTAADKFYFDRAVNLSSCITTVFIDEVEIVDFQTDPDQRRQEINNWISEVTHNEIPDMLTSGDVTSETQLVLANAAYFKGNWMNQFDPKNTNKEPFYTSPNQSSLVDMMHKRGTYNLAADEGLGATVLIMPYLTSNNESKDSEMSMIIILPASYVGALKDVMSKLTTDALDRVISESMPREIDITLPKFEFEQNLELMPILRQMGLSSIFENSNFQDFSLTTPLTLGDAKHVAKIKVDEEGSTAAAATVLFSFRSARPVEPTEFKCDHPFLFLIYDHTAQAVLFTGIYRDPTTLK